MRTEGVNTKKCKLINNNFLKIFACFTLTAIYILFCSCKVNAESIYTKGTPILDYYSGSYFWRDGAVQVSVTDPEGKLSLHMVIDNLNRVYTDYVDAGLVFMVAFIAIAAFFAGLFYSNMKMRKVQSELEENRRQYQLIFNNFPDSMIVFKDGKIVMANNKALKLLGASKQSQLKGRLKDSIFYKKSEEVLELDECYTGESGIGILPHLKLVRLDGEILEVEASVVTLPVRGGKDIQLYSFRSVSERKLIAETVELDRLKTEFFSNISHELRTPLNLILSATQAFDSGIKNGWGLEEKASKYIGIIKKNCYRLIRLVNNLIDITEINSGYFKLHLENCDVVDLVEGITQEVARSVVHKGITVLFDTDVEEKVIACDPRAIEKIILNLFSNAIKFSKHDGEVIVSIKDKGDNIAISLRDNGIGIPRCKSTIVFNDFRQVDESFTRKHEGSGVGLSLVKSLVNMHKGKVKLHSKEGKGSEFIIELPAYTLPEQDATSKKNSTSFGLECSRKVSIEFSDIYDINSL